MIYTGEVFTVAWCMGMFLEGGRRVGRRRARMRLVCSQTRLDRGRQPAIKTRETKREVERVI